MKGNQLWGHRKVSVSSLQAFSKGQASGLLTKSSFKTHCVMEIVTWTWAYIFGSYTWKSGGKIRVCRKWRAFGFACYVYTHHSQLDWKMVLNQNTSTTREGQVITQTTLKQRDHKPSEHMSVCILFRDPSSLSLFLSHTHREINTPIHLLYSSGSYALELSQLR